MISSDDIRDQVLSILQDDVVCYSIEGTRKIGCLTPIEYPDGSCVTAWGLNNRSRDRSSK